MHHQFYWRLKIKVNLILFQAQLRSCLSIDLHPEDARHMYANPFEMGWWDIHPTSRPWIEKTIRTLNLGKPSTSSLLIVSEAKLYLLKQVRVTGRWPYYSSTSISNPDTRRHHRKSFSSYTSHIYSSVPGMEIVHRRWFMIGTCRNTPPKCSSGRRILIWDMYVLNVQAHVFGSL